MNTNLHRVTASESDDKEPISGLWIALGMVATAFALVCILGWVWP